MIRWASLRLPAALLEIRDMIGASILLLLVILVVCSLGPGLFFTRKFNWSPLEKFCGGIGLSLVLVYLAAFGMYLLKLPSWSYWIITAASALMALASTRDLLKILSARQVRKAVAGFGFLLLWTLLLLSVVRHYSGGGWGGDWYEHYHRTIFFLDRLPVDTVMFGNYQVPARPPMMNILAAHFLAQAGGKFELFQITFVFLNLLVFFPCCLVLRAVVKRGGRGIAAFVCLMAACPMLVENLVYTWTKLLSGFYVVLAIWFYLAGWRKADARRTVVAFASLAAGAIVHYSVGPFIVLMGLHYLVRVLWNLKAMWRQLAAIALICAALLSTWFGWSVATYGVEATFASNTAVMASQRAAGGNLPKIAANIFDTIVPHPLREVSLKIIDQSNRLGYWRDYAFLVYQTNLPVAMGLVGGVVVICLFARGVFARGESSMARRQRWFWLMLVVLGTVIGIAVVGERERFGVAHICLPPIVFMGLALLAGSFARLARPVRWLVIAGCVVDFAIGILLHFHAQTFTFRLWAEGGRTFVDATGGIKPLSSIALGNCWVKQANDVIFLGDHLAGYSAVLQVAIVAVFALVLAVLVREALRPRAAGAGSPPARSPRDTSGGSGPSSRTARSGSSRTRDRTSRRRPPRHAGR